jgi:hypothetical protein
MKPFIFTLIFCVCSTILPAQTDAPAGDKTQEKPLIEKPDNAIFFLSLEKPGRTKRLRFYTGDYITVTFKGSKERHNLPLGKITADRVEVFDTPLDLSKIDKVILHNDNGLRKAGAFYLPIAGGLFFLGDMINPIFSGREPFQISRGSIIVPSILIGSGLILKALGKRKLKMNKNRYLRILERV